MGQSWWRTDRWSRRLDYCMLLGRIYLIALLAGGYIYILWLADKYLQQAR